MSHTRRASPPRFLALTLYKRIESVVPAPVHTEPFSDDRFRFERSRSSRRLAVLQTAAVIFNIHRDPPQQARAGTSCCSPRDHERGNIGRTRSQGRAVRRGHTGDDAGRNGPLDGPRKPVNVPPFFRIILENRFESLGVYWSGFSHHGGLPFPIRTQSTTGWWPGRSASFMPWAIPNAPATWRPSRTVGGLGLAPVPRWSSRRARRRKVDPREAGEPEASLDYSMVSKTWPNDLKVFWFEAKFGQLQ